MRTAIILATLAAAVPAWGQDAPSRASERLPIRQALDAWYRIEQGLSPGERQHCGWAREQIRPVEDREYRYEYSYESAGQYRRETLSGPAMEEVREKVIARLDGSFDILTLDAEVVIDQRKAVVEVRADSRGRTAQITSLDGSIRRVAEAGDSPVMYTLALTLLRERQKGELIRPAGRDVMLIDGAYGYDNLKMRCDVKAEGRLAYPGGRRVPVVPVEFRPADSTDDAKPIITLLLDRYGRIAETMADGEAFVRTMVDSEQEARPASSGPRQEGRRDPFQGRLTKPGERQPPPPPDMKEVMADLRRLVDRILSAARRDSATADDLYEEFYAKCQEARRSAEDAATLAALDDMEDDAHAAVGLWDHELRVAKRLSAEVRSAVERDDESAAKAAYASLKPISGRMLGGRDPAPTLEKMAAEAERLVSTMAARRELREMKLLLTGASTIQRAMKVPVGYTVCLFSTAASVSTEVQIWVHDAWAIINDNVVRVGDEVNDAGVRVEAISQFSCTVSYRGAIRELELPK